MIKTEEKKHEILKSQSWDLGSFIKDKVNYIYIGKNEEEDPGVYACGLYITRLVSPLEVVEYVLKRESTKKKVRFQRGLQLLIDNFGKNVASITLDLKCPITLTRMRYPVRGKACLHLQTFELSNFIEMNH